MGMQTAEEVTVITKPPSCSWSWCRNLPSCSRSQCGFCLSFLLVKSEPCSAGPFSGLLLGQTFTGTGLDKPFFVLFLVRFIGIFLLFCLFCRHLAGFLILGCSWSLDWQSLCTITFLSSSSWSSIIIITNSLLRIMTTTDEDDFWWWLLLPQWATLLLWTQVCARLRGSSYVAVANGRWMVLFHWFWTMTYMVGYADIDIEIQMSPARIPIRY